MKRYPLSVVVHVLFIVILSVSSFLLLEQQLWFSSIVSLLLLVSVSAHLYYMQIRYIRSMQRFMENIRSREIKLKEQMVTEEIRYQYYENLLNKVDTAVLVTDLDGKVEWINQAAVSILGTKPQVPDSLLSPSLHETRIIRLEQENGVMEMAASTTLFSTYGKEQLLISLKNIHSVLEQNEMEAWQKLIRVLTHEIMNSITPIISLSETLSERYAETEEENKEFRTMLQAMQTIHRRSKGLLGFVDNYRKLTRLPAPVYSPVSVNELLADLRKLFSHEYIHIEKFQPDVTLLIDRSQIEQVLINLLKNAQEAVARRESPCIELQARIEAEGNQLCISVTDNGEGILPEVIDKVFVPFFTTKSSGSGIGLSLCKQIMNQHGGRIRVHSQAGSGSTFTLRFPLPTDQQ